MAEIVKGNLIDGKSRCTHYHSKLDIIAIKMKCCNTYYACVECHNKYENHSLEIWSRKEFEKKAIICGECESEFSINEYLSCDNQCPNCSALFNAKCSNHYHYYFEI